MNSLVDAWILKNGMETTDGCHQIAMNTTLVNKKAPPQNEVVTAHLTSHSKVTWVGGQDAENGCEALRPLCVIYKTVCRVCYTFCVLAIGS